MLRLRWAVKLLVDIVRQGWVNGSPGLSLLCLFMLLIGLLIVGAQVSAPFIYTLF